MITLRPKQARALNALNAAFGAHTRVLLVAPTGFGKTACSVVLLQRALAQGLRCLFVAPLREIVSVTAQKLEAEGVPCGVVMAGVAPRPATVQVCSVHTLAARALAPAADLVILDEAHRSASETYDALLAAYPAAYVLGLTATPSRSDGAALEAFQTLVVGATVRELTDDGHLAPCDYVAPPAHGEGTLAMPVAEAYARYAAGRSTVVFCRSVAQAEAAALKLGGRCVHAESEDRDESLALFAQGRVPVLTTVRVLTEGWDCPRAKVAILAASFGHAGSYLQVVGRVLRVFEGQRAQVVDLCGSVVMHGLATEERSYSLTGEAIRRSSTASVSSCPLCGRCWQGAPACPGCGWTRPPALPEVRRVPLAEVFATASVADKLATFRRLLETADERGYSPGWVAHRYKSQFGHWPTAEMKREQAAGVQARAAARTQGEREHATAVERATTRTVRHV